MIYPVILAGGQGTRLWPVSTRHNPKQVLALIDGQTLLQTTYQRLIQSFDKANILVVAGQNLADSITSQLDIKNNLLVEDEPRGTALALKLAAEYILKKDPDGILLNINSDAHIKNTKKYLETLQTVGDLAQKHQSLVLAGIKPQYPATQYGYIEFGPEIESGIYQVKSFKEKPDLETAQKYLASGHFWWNATILACPAQKYLDWLNKFWPQGNLYNISVDVAILEKMTDMVGVVGDFDWTDIGDWASFKDCFPGNTLNVSVDSQNNLFYSTSKKLMTSVGVSDMIVVETDEAILVCQAARAQDVKILLAELKKQNLEKYL